MLGGTRASGDALGEQRERKRAGIREHVGCVGQEREAARGKACDHLDHEKDGRQCQRAFEACNRARIAGMPMTMSVSMTVRGPVLMRVIMPMIVRRMMVVRAHAVGLAYCLSHERVGASPR